MKPRVTVIMRTKDCEHVVGQALDGLYAQRGCDFRLHVVDSGSRDRTLEIVRRYPGELFEIAPSDYVPGRVLNQAVARAETELVVFQNSDVVPLHPEALRNLVAAMRGPLVAAAFARQVPRPEAHSWVRRDYASSFPERGPAPAWLPLSLPFAALRVAAWRSRPFYDEAWASEDTEWGAEMLRRGFSIHYVPSAVVMHSHNYTLKQLYGRRFVEGEADAFIYGTRPSLARALASTVRATVADAAWALRAGDFGGAALALPRRGVYHFAHRKGLALGADRKHRGDRDVSTGQRVVLSRPG